MIISLSNLPVEAERARVEKSKREGIGLNQAAVQLLEKAIQPPRDNPGFAEFSGAWSAEAAREFEDALAAMRSVDPAD